MIEPVPAGLQAVDLPRGSRATEEDDPERDPAAMPWPLTPAELALAGGPLRAHRVERFLDAEEPPRLRWRAEFRRPS